MNLRKYWFSIKRNLSDYGLAETLSKLFKRVIAPIYENYTYRLYCIDLQLKRPPEPKAKQGLDIDLATSKDIAIIHQIEEIAEWLRGKVLSKLENNYLCIVAMDGKKLAGFNLIALEYGHIPLLKLDWKLDEDEAWSEQITVHQDYRRQGIGLALRNKAFNELSIRGKNKFYGGALISNVQSLNLALKAGFTFTEDVQYLNILNIKKWNRREVIQ